MRNHYVYGFNFPPAQVTLSLTLVMRLLYISGFVYQISTNQIVARTTFGNSVFEQKNDTESVSFESTFSSFEEDTEKLQGLTSSKGEQVACGCPDGSKYELKEIELRVYL